MASGRPAVLDGLSLSGLVQYVLDQHGSPSTLVVCGTKEAFLKQLIAATAQDESAFRNQARQLRTEPNLRLLSTSRTVRLAFCPDITHLRAYLATYTGHQFDKHGPDMSSSGNKKRILAILNSIQLHRATSAFSAQGLNRTFSAAVEAAHHTSSSLVIAECPVHSPEPALDDSVTDDADGQPLEHPAPQSLWEEEVSILNVTTKSFGAGERGWVGRTVKLRTVAERWCTFPTLKDDPLD